jgi:hypothetical protein
MGPFPSNDAIRVDFGKVSRDTLGPISTTDSENSRERALTSRRHRERAASGSADRPPIRRRSDSLRHAALSRAQFGRNKMTLRRSPGVTRNEQASDGRYVKSRPSMMVCSRRGSVATGAGGPRVAVPGLVRRPQTPQHRRNLRVWRPFAPLGDN